MAGGKSVVVPTKEENGFRVTAQEIKEKITSKTKAILINSPCNPTGSVLTEQDIREIAQVALEYNLTSDPVQHKLVPLFSESC